MKSTFLCAAAAALVLSSCAKRPDAIVPVDIPMAAYTNLSCFEIEKNLAEERVTLARLSSEQNQAANGDAFGVFLVGVPVSSVTGGDKEGMVAASKGKVQAMELAKASKGCK
ncbi:hypothetical protein [Roseibium suaedae]|uniref:Lipoprotein n=1 Tax=Roseibium suaedae TaxID=735517 RepID=A0A1M7D7T6_9HYPH|nr:hypothetical protein [Roseibium suaedae]SHL75477.1 hypothetical protein SAMN05444272_1397 [Roseibium suaedae]